MWKSNKTKDKMSGGTDTIQTTKGKECLTLWAKACATVLPCQTTWERNTLKRAYNR